jgi:hypothetical protein
MPTPIENTPIAEAAFIDAEINLNAVVVNRGMPADIATAQATYDAAAVTLGEAIIARTTPFEPGAKLPDGSTLA